MDTSMTTPVDSVLPRTLSAGPAGALRHQHLFPLPTHTAGPQSVLGRMGNVRHIVGEWPPPIARDATSRLGPDLHGAAEHGTGSWRDARSRERQRASSHRDARSDARDVRERAAAAAAIRQLGPQNRADFDNVIEGITDRLDAVEVPTSPCIYACSLRL